MANFLNMKFFLKDNVIIPRVSLVPEDFRSYTDLTVDHMESFAKEGFRTLVLAYRIISDEEYDVKKLIDLFELL